MSYLLSIVIPTRNRQKYAVAAVKQIYDVTDNRVQIVISDNSDDNSLLNDLQKMKFSDRVKYCYTSKRITGVDNYSKGVEMSDGEYLCCIGDDDGVMRYIVEITEFAHKHNVEAISQVDWPTYYWPGVLRNHKNGALAFFSLEVRGSVKICNPKASLENLIKDGGISFLNNSLARAYHGIVKKECFDKIKGISGKYCNGLAPDIYFGTALSLVIKKTLVVDVPFTISGVCGSSESGKSANKKDYGDITSFTSLEGLPYSWTGEAPAFYSSYTVWLETLVCALKDMNSMNLLNLFDLKQFCVRHVLAYPKSKKHCEEFYYEKTGEKLNISAKLLLSKCKNNVARIAGIVLPENIKGKLLNRKYYENIGDIIEAEKFVYKNMIEQANQCIIELNALGSQL